MDGSSVRPGPRSAAVPPADAPPAGAPPASAPPRQDGLRVIGRPLRKVDARPKVIGQTRFADDLTFPRMLHCKLHRSTKAFARIKRVDVSKALALPGVVIAITGEHFPDPFGILPVSQDEHALCQDLARFVGDPIAAVAALEEDIAEEAARLVEVEYEEFPAVMSVQDAIRRPEPRIQTYGDDHNLHKLVALEFGQPEQGFAEATRVREDLYFYQGNTHLPLEQHSAVAVWEPDGKVTIHSSTQTPHYLHKAAAKVLKMPAARVRIIALPNGGGFGGKSDPFNHEIVVAKLAQLTGRPVKIALTREEVFFCHRGRHPVLMSVKAGARQDGSLAALQFKTFLDGGAYGSYGVASTFYTGALQTVTYNVDHYKFDGMRAFTNKPPCGPKRGHGTPQPRFGLEVTMDKLAEDLGLDPVAIRKRHLVPPDTTTANWLHVTTNSLGTCIDKVVEGSDFFARHRKLPFGKGVGLACGSYLSGAGLPIYWNNMPHSGVQLKLDRSGLVTIFCGSTDIGQGSDSILAYIIAEILGVDPFETRVITADTDLTPVDLGSYSSRVTLMTGNAAIQAAERARDILAKAVGEKLEVPPSRLVFADNRVFDSSKPELGVLFAEAVQLAESRFGTVGTTGSYVPPRMPGRYKGAGVGPSPCYSYSACVVEVDVDPDTGIVTVPKVWIAHDIGRSVNPVLALGQVEGSVYMGLGEALMEEQVFRRNVHKIPSMLEYKSPTTWETPEIITYLVEDPDPRGPFGAKEVGQGPLLPVPPAVAIAVYDAVGVRIDEVPVTPEKVLRALHDKQAGRPGRFGPPSVPNYKFPEPIRVLTPKQGGDGKAYAGEVERRKQTEAERLGGGR
jgi:4-hydroxybenzoyl-CoA reductase subunit alpha